MSKKFDEFFDELFEFVNSYNSRFEKSYGPDNLYSFRLEKVSLESGKFCARVASLNGDSIFNVSTLFLIAKKFGANSWISVETISRFQNPCIYFSLN